MMRKLSFAPLRILNWSMQRAQFDSHLLVLEARPYISSANMRLCLQCGSQTISNGQSHCARGCLIAGAALYALLDIMSILLHTPAFIRDAIQPTSDPHQRSFRNEKKKHWKQRERMLSSWTGRWDAVSLYSHTLIIITSSPANARRRLRHATHTGTCDLRTLSAPAPAHTVDINSILMKKQHQLGGDGTRTILL